MNGCRNTDQLCLHSILYLFPSLGEYNLNKNLGLYWETLLNTLSDTLPFSLLAFSRPVFSIVIFYTKPGGLGWTLTFKWGHGLQDAKLFENCHEEDDDHTNGKQFHALEPHDSWMEVVAGVLRAKSARDLAQPGEVKEDLGQGRTNPGLTSRQVLSGGNQGSVWRECDSMGLVPGPENSV